MTYYQIYFNDTQVFRKKGQTWWHSQIVICRGQKSDSKKKSFFKN